jgi:hypothetical protein
MPEVTTGWRAMAVVWWQLIPAAVVVRALRPLGAVAFAVDSAGGFDHLRDQGSRERQQEKHCKESCC